MQEAEVDTMSTHIVLYLFLHKISHRAVDAEQKYFSLALFLFKQSDEIGSPALEDEVPLVLYLTMLPKSPAK